MEQLRFAYAVRKEHDGHAIYTFAYNRPVTLHDGTEVLEYSVARCDPWDRFEKAVGRYHASLRYTDAYVKVITEFDVQEYMREQPFTSPLKQEIINDFVISDLKHWAISEVLAKKELGESAISYKTYARYYK